jgi:tRNA pseudouridine38-40 synthase
MYHGAHYNGWQVQTNAKTIQGTIQTVLTKMHKEPVSITGSGRTDAGVHAFGQTFHFDSPLNLTEEQWIKAINSSLPHDIRILDAQFVDARFHARYSVIRKRYDYLVIQEEINPFTYQTHLSVTQHLSLKKMRQAMNLFIGAHDFSSFCSNSFEETPNQIRTIFTFDLEEEEGQLRFILEGDGFLRYMVRMLIAVILDVGKGKLTIEQVSSILEAKDKQAYSGIVDPCGLYLMEVFYKEQYD